MPTTAGGLPAGLSPQLLAKLVTLTSISLCCDGDAAERKIQALAHHAQLRKMMLFVRCALLVPFAIARGA